VFDVVVLDSLLGDGTMLLGAKALRETARPPAAWVHPDDAASLGLHDGAHLAVVGPGGRVELPVRVTAALVPGCVVLPGPSSAPSPGSLAAAGEPLRVRLEPLTGEATGDPAAAGGAE
jgi:anaerobic selenocysteine-containing dehydrogenase